MLHKTKDGKYIPIAALTDDDLLNIIRLPFKKFDNADNKLLSFMLGKEMEGITPEKFNSIISNNCFTILEALRRKSTRQKVIHFLSTYNEIWKSDERIEASTDILKSLNPPTSNKYDEDIFYDDDDDSDDYNYDINFYETDYDSDGFFK